MLLYIPRTSKTANLPRVSKLECAEGESLITLRQKVAAIFGSQNFNILHQGRLIKIEETESGEKEAKTLATANLKPSATIHAVPKAQKTVEGPLKEAAAEKPGMTDDEIQTFLIAFSLATRNSAFHKVALRLSQKENMENLVATCSGLASDPIAIAFLSKPELLYSLLDPETLKYVHKNHPALIEAASQIAGSVHEERPSPSTSGGRGGEDPPPPFAYNLDEMDDDDDEEEDEHEDMDTSGPRQGGGQRRSVTAPITQDQLQAAIAAAQNTLGMGGGGGMGGMTGMTHHATGNQSRGPAAAANPLRLPPMGAGSSSRSGASTSSASAPSAAGFGITQDQLAAALAFAVGGGASGGGNPFTGVPQTSAAPAPPPPNMEENISRMLELGITDRNLASRALTVMGGDVQAAVDLIFSGWKGDDEAAN